MSATPRTDALSAKLWNESTKGSITERGLQIGNELADFARQLETELAEMTATAKRLAERLADFVEHVSLCEESDLLACDTDKHPPSVFSVYADYAEKALTEAREKGLL